MTLGDTGSFVRVAGWGTAQHGGSLRSQQLLYLAKRALPGVQVRNPERPHLGTIGPIFSALGTLAKAGQHAGKYPMRQLLAGSWLAQQLRSRGHKPQQPILYDADQRFGQAMAFAAQILDSPLVAFTHNLESHYAIYRAKRDPIGKFASELRRELQWLSTCQSVWSIGLIEHRLFSLCGIKSRLLPYFPTPERLAQLSEVRRRRLSTDERDIVLIMGAAGNEPTFAGMQQQLSYLSRTSTRRRFVVVGTGTERLKPFRSDLIRVHGAATWDELSELFARTRSLWVHQAAMTGALTRITETLLIGIPVVANDWATAGLSPMAGLFAYQDIEDAIRLLDSVTDAFPAPPEPPELQAYIDYLRSGFS